MTIRFGNVADSNCAMIHERNVHITVREDGGKNGFPQVWASSEVEGRRLSGQNLHVRTNESKLDVLLSARVCLWTIVPPFRHARRKCCLIVKYYFRPSCEMEVIDGRKRQDEGRLCLSVIGIRHGSLFGWKSVGISVTVSLHVRTRISEFVPLD